MVAVAPARRRAGSSRRRRPCCVWSIAWASPGDSGCGRAVGEGRQLAAHQPVQPIEHDAGRRAAAAQRRAVRHQPRLLGHAIAAGRAAAVPAAAACSAGRPRIAGVAGEAARTAGCTGAGPRAVGAAAAEARRPAAVAAVRPVALQRHVARPADQRVQVDLGQHAAVDEPSVGLVVGLLDQACQLFMQRLLQLAPAVQAATRCAPAFDDDARQHVRAQQVAGLELFAPLERRHPRAQVGEFRRAAVGDRQCQARSEDLALDRVVIDQRQVRGRRAGPRQLARAQRRRALQQRVAQAADHRPVPGGRALLQLAHQLAPAHEAQVLGRLGQQPVGGVGERVDCRRQALDQLLRVDAPRLLGDAGVVGAAGHGGWFRNSVGFGPLYTTAPELGSFGSASFVPALTRSSRLTRSHITMPAATKIDE